MIHDKSSLTSNFQDPIASRRSLVAPKELMHARKRRTPASKPAELTRPRSWSDSPYQTRGLGLLVHKMAGGCLPFWRTANGCNFFTN